MDKEPFVSGLLDFLTRSPTPFHAARNMAHMLDSAGFRRLDERDRWDLAPGERAYVLRNEGSLIAFRSGADLHSRGIRMVGAHTDSPCLRVKPNAELDAYDCLRLGVEVYGGVLLNPWFDRDLSLTGRVHYLSTEDTLHCALIAFDEAIATIPSLAIHLDREANQSRSVNPQNDIPPLLACITAGAQRMTLHEILAARIEHEHPDARVARILDHELCFFDTQGASRIGLNGEFISGARLDNLVSCWCGLQALLASEDSVPAVLVCNDHEEVGSASSSGAAGPFLHSVLERLGGSGEDLTRLLARSMLISADNAHALHPNYPDRHDGNHGPRLNGGPVIKVNANQRYASNSATQALFRQICSSEDIPVQSFVVRTDMACGSTIGPITASALGVRTLDVGVPQLAMHSIRELCGSEDPWRLMRALTRFLSLAELPGLD